MGQLFTSFAAAVDMLAPAAATAGGGVLVFLKVLKLAFATLADSLQQRKNGFQVVSTLQLMLKFHNFNS